MKPLKVQLLGASGKVSAVMREMDPIIDLQSWKNHWKPLLRSSSAEDRHWDWMRKYASFSSVNFEYYAIECEQMTQGMMIVETDFLKTPRYRGTGSLLMYLAVSRSEQLGYKHRTGLHSLPAAREFYRKLGMRDFGNDPDYQNLHYFEFDDQTGKAFVHR